MIGIGTSLLFGRRAGKAGPPIPPFNKAMVDAWFMSGLSNVDKPSSIRGIKGNEMQLKNFAFTSESGFGKGVYDGALVFDGVDDYGVWEGKPLLTDFTIICKREWADPTENRHVALASTRKGHPDSYGAFVFEKISQGSTASCALWSFGNTGNRVPTYIKTGVTYMTPTDYNGTPIKKGVGSDNNLLLLGAGLQSTRQDKVYEFFNGSIYYFALYNKSLTPEEIETEKERLNEEWLKRSKVTIPEPDVYYDLSLKDNSSPTRNIIDDLSGNGHDAEIFNAAYTESSGYRSDGAFVFDGVDDYAIMQNVTKGFKTLFMEVIPLKVGGMMYDQRISTVVLNFSIYNESRTFAYNSRNNGVTYINGKINSANITTDELINKRSIVTAINALESNCKTIAIASTVFQGVYCNMALYKLIGFYDELTPLQIEKVINDYKLKYD